MPDIPPASLRGLRGDFDMDIVLAFWSCRGAAPVGGMVSEWRLGDDTPPAAPGLELTLPDGARLHDSLAVIEALLARRDFAPLPSMTQFPVAGFITRILIHFIAGWLRRTALHDRWIAGADTACIQDMARRWLALPESATDDPFARELIDRTAAQLRAHGRHQAEFVGAGAQAAHEIGAEWSRLQTMLHQHIAAGSALFPSPCGGPDLPGLCLAAAAHGGLPLDSRTVAQLDEGSEIAAQTSPEGNIQADGVPESLAPILQYIAMSYHPVLRVNCARLAESAQRMTVDLGYGAHAMPCQPGWEAARLALARDIEAMGDQQRSALRQQLAPLGVLAAYDAA